MNILYTNFHPRNGGGHATYIINLAKALHKDHNITVATPATSRLFAQTSKIDGVKVIDKTFSTRLSQMLPELKSLRKIISDGNFDLVHVNGSADHRQVMLASKFLSKKPKIIWTKHNTMPIKSFGNSLRAKFGTDAAIGVSNFVTDILRQSPFAKLPNKTIYHGVNTDIFTPVTDTQKSDYRQAILGENHQDLIMLASVGGTDRDKGWLELAGAIAKLDDEYKSKLRLVVAGDPIKGPLLNDFMALNISDNVIFPGLIDTPQRLLAAADIGFVLSWHEAFSFAAAESLACGLPTLVSDAGGLPEVVRNQIDGWVVPAKNINAIAKCLKHILTSGVDANMSKAARQRAVTEFSLNTFAANTLSFYKQICV